MDTSENLLSAELQLDTISLVHLKETARWAKFLGIMGFIFSVLIGIAGLFAGTVLSSMSKMNPGTNMFINTGVISVIYLVIGLIYFLLSLYLYSFGSKMQVALRLTDQSVFNDSLLNLKRVYRMMGVITIIYLAIIALVMIGGIIAAVFMRR